jgi:hypothetical protein
MKRVILLQVVVASLLGAAALLVAWERPGTAAVWLAAAYMVWPTRS